MIRNEENGEKDKMVCGDIVRYNAMMTFFPGRSAAKSQ